jgi:chromosome segregation ATPase
LDPFTRFETLARGGNPNPPPAPFQLESQPTVMTIDGVKIASARLTELDRLARSAKATQAGLAERIGDLRADLADAKRRLSLLQARAGAEPLARSDAAVQAQALEAEIAQITKAARDVEDELNAAAEAAGAARANLRTAVEFARLHGLLVPVGIALEGRGNA